MPLPISTAFTAWIDRTARHARSRFAGAGALEHIPRLAEVELQASCQIGVTGPGRRKRLVLGARLRAVLHRHRLTPVFPVAVLKQNRNGRADRLAMPDAGKELGRVRLNLHSPAPPVSTLAPLEIAIDVGEVHAQSRR